MKIIHVTDPHIRAGGQRVFGRDPVATLKAIIDDINVRHADADLAVITGDLVDDGQPTSYGVLAELLSGLNVPVRLLVGNHDNRAAFIRAFPDHPVDTHGFVQSYIDAPSRQGRLLFVDSAEENFVGGRICGQRLGWIKARLDEAADRPAVVFLHHPPLPVGVPHFERICLQEPQAFLDCLKAHRGGIRHIFVGHIHIPLTGVYPGGLPFTAGRGSNHQIILDFNRRDVDWAAGPANYSIIDLGDDSLFVHAFDFLDADVLATRGHCDGP